MSPEKIEKYYKKYKRKRLSSIKYIVWKGYLWIQVPPKAMGPAYTNVFSRETLGKIKKLDFNTAKKLLGEFYSDTWISEFMIRRDQILQASELENAILIP